jgi:hypothetical protein
MFRVPIKEVHTQSLGGKDQAKGSLGRPVVYTYDKMCFEVGCEWTGQLALLGRGCEQSGNITRRNFWIRKSLHSGGSRFLRNVGACTETMGRRVL